MDLLERKKQQDLIQEEFNNYKRAGSTLLQAKRIDAKKYYANVRNKGIKLGLLTEDDYPTDLPNVVEPLMRIGGATIGAIAGTALSPVLGSAAGAGAGGAGATALYREMAELLNPDLPLAPIGKKFRDAGLAGLVDFGGTLIIGGVLNQGGKLLRDSAKISARGAGNLGNKSAEELKKIGANIRPKIGFLQRMFTSKQAELDGLVKKTMTEMEEQGLTPYMGAMSPEIVKSYFEAAGVMPLFGSPIRNLFTTQIDELITRLVSGVKKDIRLGRMEGKSPLLSPGSFIRQGNQIVKNPARDKFGNEIMGDNTGAAFINLVEKNLNALIKNKKEAYGAFNKSINNVKNISATSKVSFKDELEGTAKQLSLRESFGIAKNGSKGGFGIFRQQGEREASVAVQEMKQYMSPNDKKYLLKNVKFTDKGNITGKNLHQLHSNIRDSLSIIQKKQGANIEIASPITLARLRDAKAVVEGSLRMAGPKGNQAFKQLKTAQVFGQNLRNEAQVNKPALDLMGSENIFKSLADETLYQVPSISMKQAIANKASLGNLIDKYYKNNSVKAQDYLKKTLDSSSKMKGQYKAMVTQELDDIFYNTVFTKTNLGKSFKSTIPELRKALGLGEKNSLLRTKMNAAYGEKEATRIFTELPKIANVMEKYIITNPNMSNFVVRNAVLSGSIGVGAIGALSFGLGGYLGTAVSMGAMYGITRFLAQPYAKQLVNTSLTQSATAAGRDATKRIGDEISKFSRVSAKFNQAKEEALSKANPEAYKKLMKMMQQAGLKEMQQVGLEITAQSAGMFERPDEKILGGI